MISSSALLATPAPVPTGKARITCVQMLAGSDKAANLAAARASIESAAAAGADIVVLPECFNSPYATDQFPVYAEVVPASKSAIDAEQHPSVAMLSAVAAASKVFVVGGAWGGGVCVEGGVCLLYRPQRIATPLAPSAGAACTLLDLAS